MLIPWNGSRASHHCPCYRRCQACKEERPEVFSKQAAVTPQGSHQPSLEKPVVASGITGTRTEMGLRGYVKFSTSDESSWGLSRRPGEEMDCVRSQSKVPGPLCLQAKLIHVDRLDKDLALYFRVFPSSHLLHCPASRVHCALSPDAGLRGCLYLPSTKT